MGVGRFFHYIGAVFLLAATVLLIVASITAPVVNNISILRVNLNGLGGQTATGINYGTFGYCVTRNNGGDSCSSSRIGYNPVNAFPAVNSSNDDLDNIASSTARALTYVMVLHPVGAGLCFIAFLLAVFPGVVGSLLSAIIATLALFVTLVALACDFAGFSIVRRRINRDTQASASWGVGIWLVLAAAVLSLIGTIVVFFTCCAGRRRRSRESKKMAAYQQSSPTRY
ncbi:hypothetical protein F66182_9842 [Fusarium sp. NRRL 66182]|nr:hypothetical protein F66182_9842 [Fusarium sp. NRRL 66182]